MTAIHPIAHDRHADARIRLPADPSPLRFVRLGASELGAASADFPILLAKEAQTGRFNLIALFSLAEPRNLYWQGGAWQATYVPAAVRLAPFRLDDLGACGLAIDEAVLGSDGLPLFAPDGQPAELLRDAATQLRGLVADMATAQALVDRLAALKLVRPLACRLRHADGHPHTLDGLFTVGTEALEGLEDGAIVDLHRCGGLAMTAVLRASLSQLERLRRLHNASAETPIAGLTATIAD